ncbi:hypothetical protein [uncultured Phocaeicola sp.]|uniref:hypothetical protein n=1 Tax=uncultured Phocaeicola sp. TaxID=990718 RepID=UPI0026197660|nr:hypothetical protein [uncultured Phocaeicola sp.]
MDNDYILSVIREYADECLKEPVWHISRDWFKQISYSRWAVDEILKRIEESKFTPPIMVVEDFIRKMDDFSCKNKKTSIIFSVAHDMAENILDVLIAMK